MKRSSDGLMKMLLWVSECLHYDFPVLRRFQTFCLNDFPWWVLPPLFLVCCPRKNITSDFWIAVCLKRQELLRLTFLLSETALVLDVLGRTITEWRLSDASRARVLVGGFESTVEVSPSIEFYSNLPFYFPRYSW